MNVQDLLVILNLILIEGLLSVDNAAVLAVMVRVLPLNQQQKALKYGIIGAYVFRGVALLLASYMMGMWWLKVAGGLYLLWITYKFFKAQTTETKEDDLPHSGKTDGWLVAKIGLFWATIIGVEIADMAFSIDNVLAAAAMSPKIWVVWTGVFIGILAMRFVAGRFVKLMQKYPVLEKSAFYVIALLGIKLVLSIVVFLAPESGFSLFLEGKPMEWGISIATLAIFFGPVIFSKKKKEVAPQEDVEQQLVVAETVKVEQKEVV